MKRVIMSTSPLLWLLVSLLFVHTHSIYFHMVDTQTKCFLEEVPAETMVQGIYRIEVSNEESKTWRVSEHGLFVKVYDPAGEVMLSRLYAHEGKFSFTPHTAGDYKVCLSSNSSHWFGGEMLRVHLSLVTGSHAQDYKEVAAHDKLDELQLRIRQLIDQVEMISKDQDFQRVREAQFRSLSERTYSNVTWLSLTQVALLILIGVWQMKNLKSFFQAKKLV